MFNAINLLGSILQQRAAPSAGQRLGTAFGQGGPLGGLLSQFGGSGSTGGGALGSLMGALSGSGRNPDADKQRFMDLARQAASNPGREIANNNPLAVGGLGALAGTLLGGGQGAVGGGLVAVLGSLAYSALQSGGGQANPAPGSPALGAAASGGYAQPGAPPPALTHEDVQHTALLMLRSMIQAAKADGQLDAAEIERITSRIGEGDQAGAAEARAFVLQQMAGPPDMAGLVREVRSPVEAAEAYGAALLAIEVDAPAERDYLARLASELRLQPSTVARLHASMGVPPPG